MASALDTARAAIEGAVATAWGDGDTVAWPGLSFAPGADDWCRPTLQFSAGQLEGMGSGGVGTVEGLLLLDVFTRGKLGLGVLYDYVDTLRDAFDRATIGAAEFLAASGPRDVSDDEWQGLQIEVPFIIEETS